MTEQEQRQRAIRRLSKQRAYRHQGWKLRHPLRPFSEAEIQAEMDAGNVSNH